MEQVYVIKLKELPLASQSLENGKSSDPLDGKDLMRRSLFGFSVFQLVLGLLSIIFSLLGATRDWTHTFGIIVGVTYILISMIGILVSESNHRSVRHRSLRFSASITFIYITIAAQSLCMLISFTFIWLTVFGVICKQSSSMNLQTSLITANFLEFCFALLSGFTCIRLCRPSFLSSWIHGWPDRPKVGHKVIVKTSIYPSGLKDANFSRFLGPNCVVSLVPPNNNVPSSQRNDNGPPALTTSSPRPSILLSKEDRGTDPVEMTEIEEICETLSVPPTPSPRRPSTPINSDN